MNAVHKRLKGQPTNQRDADSRTITWVMTTGATDRDGETVEPTGGDFTEYAANPTVQFNHDTDSPPIGRLEGMPWNDYIGDGSKYPEVPGPKRMALLGRVKFSKENPLADQVYRQALEGTIKGGSISFVPTGSAKKNNEGGNHYDRWKLLEFTICSVGSNPDAVATNKKHLKRGPIIIRALNTDSPGIVMPFDEQVYDSPRGGPQDFNNSQYQNKKRSLRAMNIRKRHRWVGPNSKGHPNKALWLLKSEGGVQMADGTLNQETKDYLQMRGLDEVRLEDDAPPVEAGYAPQTEQKMDNKPASALKVGDIVSSRDFGEQRIVSIGPDRMNPAMIFIKYDDGTSDTLRPNERPKTIGAQPPEGKTEEVADDVATRAADMVQTMGVDMEPAVDAAIDEQAVPKGSRPAVKALAMKRMKGIVNKVTFSKGQMIKHPEFGTGQVIDVKNDLVMVAWDNGGKSWVNISSVQRKGIDDDEKDKKQRKALSPGKVVRTKSGNLCLVKSVDGKTAKLVKVNGDETEEKVKGLKVKAAGWGEPSKITAWGDMQAKLTNWYGNLTGMLKHAAPALKDADLTGDEQKAVEDVEEEAFMKAAEELGVEAEEKNADSIVPQLDANTEKPSGDGIAPETGSVGTDSTGSDLSTVPQDQTGGSNPKKRLTVTVPKKEYKAFLKRICAKAAEKAPAKLQATAYKRALKFVRKALPSNDLDPATACHDLKAGEVNGQPLTVAQRGMFGAACARASKKLSKKFPGGCGKKRCSKSFLCKRCCKGLLKRLKKEVPPEVLQPQEMVVPEVPPVDEKSINKDTDTLTPDSSISNLEGSPTSGGTDTPKSFSKGDDDNDVMERAKRLLQKGDSDDDDEEMVKTFIKGADELAAKAKEMKRLAYQRTANPALRV